MEFLPGVEREGVGEGSSRATPPPPPPLVRVVEVVRGALGGRVLEEFPEERLLEAAEAVV